MLFTTCDIDSVLGDGYFDYELRGTWETNQDQTQYAGILVIDYSTIKITGYIINPSYEYTYGDDKRPFKDFTKNTSLKGYSEDGKLFIYDKGILQAGIPYNYYTTGAYGQDKFLEINFNGRDEILKRTN